MISASRAGSSCAFASRARSSAVQSKESGMAQPRDAGDRFNELAPAPALRVQRREAALGDRVIAAATLAGLLHPPSGDPAALLHAIEQRIQRRDVERQRA